MKVTTDDSNSLVSMDEHIGVDNHAHKHTDGESVKYKNSHSGVGDISNEKPNSTTKFNDSITEKNDETIIDDKVSKYDNKISLGTFENPNFVPDSYEKTGQDFVCSDISGGSFSQHQDVKSSVKQEKSLEIGRNSLPTENDNNEIETRFDRRPYFYQVTNAIIVI